MQRTQRGKGQKAPRQSTGIDTCYETSYSNSTIVQTNDERAVPPLHTESRPPPRKRHPPEQAIHDHNRHENPYPLARPIRAVSILRQHAPSVNSARARQPRLIHAVTPNPTTITPLAELVHHHPLEHVSLVVNVVKHVAPKDIELVRRDQKPADGHPEAVREGRDGKGGDEDGNQGCNEDDEGFGGQQVQIQPQDPHPERRGVVTEPREPVRDNGEEDGDGKKERQADQEIRCQERGRPVEAVGALLDEEGAVLEEGGDVRDGHEGHEGAAEENGVDERLDVGLRGVEAQPDGPHHDGEAHVHDEADPVGEDVAVRFDEGAVDEGEDQAEQVRFRGLSEEGVLSRPVGVANWSGLNAHRFTPGLHDTVESLLRARSVCREIYIEKVDEMLCWVCMRWVRMAYATEVLFSFYKRAGVRCLSLGK